MSRIGKKPIQIPEKVEVKFDHAVISAKGEKGELSMTLHKEMKLERIDNKILVKIEKKNKFVRALHGLTRKLIENLLIGVSKGYEKDLEVIGVGYRVALKGDDLALSLGYSHPITIKAPNGIKFGVKKNIISVSGIDKQLVGQIAAEIRETRKPEPYKGKGIKYKDEIIKRKAGKAAKSSEGAAK